MILPHVGILRTAFMIVVSSVLAFEGESVSAQNAESARPAADVSHEEFLLPLDATTAVEAAALIRQLGSPDYEKRELASNRLTEIGAAALALLRDAYRQTEDLEVRLRIELIVHEVYLNRHVFSKIGYLGIRRGEKFPTPATDPRIPAGHIGVVIEQVTPDTAAARAGLMEQDVVLALDGTPLGKADSDGFQAFGVLAQAIRERGAGGKIKLTVLRGTQVMEVSVTLGQLPRNGRNFSIMGIRDEYNRAYANFLRWWEFHFLLPSTRAAAPGG